MNRPDVIVKIRHRGELVAAIVTRRLARVVLFVTGEGIGVMEHLQADITDIVIVVIAVAIVLIYSCKK